MKKTKSDTYKHVFVTDLFKKVVSLFPPTYKIGLIIDLESGRAELDILNSKMNGFKENITFYYGKI